MKKNSLTTGLAIMFIFSIYSCGNKSRENIIIIKYPDGTIKSERTLIKNDSFDYKCKDFYANGKIKSEYYVKDSIMQGYNESYYPNGNIESEGNWLNGQRSGYFKFYDSTGALEKKIEYINYQGNERPNQLIQFDKNGDTLLNGQSLFYDFYYNKDTIKLNKEQYEFKIVLTGHKYDYAHIRFCDYDEKYFLKSEKSCQGSEMKNFEVHLFPTDYKIGYNYIRGVILNYKNPIKENDTNNRYVEVYFSDTFYVVP